MRNGVKARVVVLWLVSAWLASGCGPATDPNADVLKIGAYSVVREVLHDGLMPAFASEWKSRRAGRHFRRVVQRLGGPGAGDRVGV